MIFSPGSPASDGPDITGTPSAGDYARWSDANTLEARTTAQVLSDIAASSTLATWNSGAAASGMKLTTAIPATGAADGAYCITWKLVELVSGYGPYFIDVQFRVASGALSGTPHSLFRGPDNWTGSYTSNLAAVSIEGGFFCVTLALGNYQFYAEVTAFGSVTTASYYSGWAITNAAAVSGTNCSENLDMRGSVNANTMTAGTSITCGWVMTSASLHGNGRPITGALCSTVAAYPTSNQTALAADTYNKILFGSERVDAETAFASSTFTAPRTGNYRISLNLAFATDSATGSDVILVLYVNGARVVTTARKFNDTLQNTVQSFAAEWTVPLTAGQTVEVYEQHEDGTGTVVAIETVSGNSDTGSTELMIHWIGTY